MNSCFYFLFMILYLCSPFSLIAKKDFEKSKYSKSKHTRTLVAISFHFVPERLKYLQEVLEGLSTFPQVDVAIITNTIDVDKLEAIKQLSDNEAPFGNANMKIFIRTFPKLNHPFELTWCHKSIIKNEFLDSLYTHFIYLEDDIKMNLDNFCYFLHFRKILRPHGLIPSFLRVEYQRSTEKFVNTDNPHVNLIAAQPHFVNNKFVFINVNKPYTACFVLDQELANEYVISKSFDLIQSQFYPWDIRERAAMGLCFENIPTGYHSRYVVPVSISNQEADHCVWVYHLPNNYANNPQTSYGTIPMDRLFDFSGWNHKTR